MELLSPAGNLEKLKYVYAYGADAAYIGIKNFSLRARSDNFTFDGYRKLITLKGQKRLYGALNIYFHNDDLKKLEENLGPISRYPFDALIISDLGALEILKKAFPTASFHLSTQANCLNYNAAAAYRDMGFSRIIAGRETSLKDIEKIKTKVSNLEIEVFAHGAMCLAYSGRCFLSAYMADRGANSGDCSHSCRWRYRALLEEEKRPGEYFPLIEGDNFTTILSSKDLCMIDHMRDLKNAGVDSVKIEGRMKSIYYAAIITRAYRKTIDNLNGEDIENLKDYQEEIYKVSRREFSTGFFFGKEKISIPTEKSYLRRYMFIGIILDQTAEGFWRLEVKNQIRVNTEIEYIGPSTLYIKDGSFELFDENMRRIEKIDHGKVAYLKSDKEISEGYLIRQKID